MIMKDAGYLIAAGGALAALVYIGRQVGKVAALLSLLGRLPTEHAQLLEATKVNTTQIAALTTQMQQLTADVSRLVRQ